MPSKERSSSPPTSTSASKRAPVPASAAKKQIKYKKPPDAPKRFKSAYIFFSIAKHPEIREKMETDGSTEKTTNVAKLVSEAWRNLTAGERSVWEEKARKDKARYEVEKSMYTGPWKVSSKKLAKKDAAAPRRPMSAFLAFSNATRAQVKQKHPGMANIEVTKILAQLWKDAPDSERCIFIDREAELRKEYLVAISEWRATVAAQEYDERQKREQIAMDVADKMEAQGDKDFSTFATRYAGSSPTDLNASSNPSSMPLLFPPSRTQNVLDANTSNSSMPLLFPPTSTSSSQQNADAPRSMTFAPPTAMQSSSMSQSQNMYDSYNIPPSSYGAPSTSNHNDMMHQSAASNMLQANLYNNSQYKRGGVDPNIFGGQQQGTSMLGAPQSMQEFTALNQNRTPSFYPDQQQQQIMMMQSLSNNNNSVGQIMDPYAGASMYGGNGNNGGGGNNNNLQMQQHLQLQQMAAMNRGMGGSGGGGGNVNNNSLQSDPFFKKN